jgi:DNA-3-methyladenine glycosylase I
MKTRCPWVSQDPMMIHYHDNEWGVPVHNDRLLFEFLVLEGAQAGLSWTTILKKRENYRTAFSNFEPEQVAAYDDGKLEELRNNPGIVRNKLKIGSAVTNASLILELTAEFGSFNSFIWKFVNEIPIQNNWEELSDIPSSTPESEKMSKELKRRGFKFVGPTICYSFMQAVGMVNDHTVDCFRHNQLISDSSE